MYNIHVTVFFIIALRDNNWLTEKMYELWDNHFDDIARHNLVVIRFGKRSHRQLGCIKWSKKRTNDPQFADSRVSEITITKYYMAPEVPDDVVTATIAHEMCHYAHGFNSPLQQIYKHPHKGKVIEKEMVKRGLGHLLKTSEAWLKQNWAKHVKENRLL